MEGRGRRGPCEAHESDFYLPEARTNRDRLSKKEDTSEVRSFGKKRC
jgi:hypothetical protein